MRNNPDYRIQKPGEKEFRTLRLMALFQMAYLGAPMVYYGTESGMWGADDPDDRKPMVWDDVMYEAEESHPLPGRTRSRDEVRFDHELFQYFKKIIRIRNEHPALRRGAFRTLLADDKRGIFAFERILTPQRVIAVFNNSDNKNVVRIQSDGKSTDLVSGRTVPLNAVELVPKSGMLLLPQ